MSLTIAIATACLWRRRSCFSFSPSPPEASILLLKARRRFRVGGVDCVVGFVLIPSCWIVLLGCVDSELLGLFFWFAGFVAGGLCGFRCDTGVGCWVCFSGLLGLLPVDCVDSGVGWWLWVGGCVAKEMNILFE